MYSDLLLLIFVGLVFLIPVAIYVLLVALLNRGAHPVLVPGAWDFAEVLFACSGFLLFGLPCTISNFSYRWREYWLHGKSLSGAGTYWWTFWFAVFIAYFTVLTVVIVLLLRNRRRTAVIYNIEPDGFGEILMQVLDELKLEPQRVGPTRVLVGEKGELHWDSFRPMCNITLHWNQEMAHHKDAIEEELAQAFRRMYTHYNPARAWLVSASLSLFIMIFFAAAGLVYLIMKLPRF